MPSQFACISLLIISKFFGMVVEACDVEACFFTMAVSSGTRLIGTEQMSFLL